MESQNHYYGHSSAFARYVGLDRPRHVRGLVQHGWTPASPVTTHFRDFPTIGAPGGPQDRSLFVWSHASRAWSPDRETRRTVAIGAPWLYLVASTGADAAAGDAGRRSGTVIMPVHGIPTQRLHGDHAAIAQEWARTVGPSTVCLYHLEADDPHVVAAYRSAGHRCVTLGQRTDPAFLSRLHTLLTSAERVVSNRLSTPLVYAAGLGIDTLVHGDAMRLDGEQRTAVEAVASTWPEFHDPSASLEDRRRVAAAELGAASIREPAELREILGWDRTFRVGPWWDHWVGAPVDRAVTNLRRRSSATTPPPERDAAEPAPLSAAAWLRGAVSYLPRPLGRTVDPGRVAPRPVS
ncbi:MULTISPECIES: hypothetical protein [unclassified Actinotalea]|uniref:hypothetical protein n=1 Tax=unclassified Actinotalea TaxID=2638618 RepID=UPI0015F76D3D|nr:MULTISPECIES: hypothetical protein [unclassified Actinotalea]